jgi:hypothetical protein
MKPQNLTILPPAQHLCQKCAVAHGEMEAHNAQSLYYAFWFNEQHGRSPTWRDAIAHCPDDIKEAWAKYLGKLGVDPHSTNLTGELKSQSDVNHLLAD